MAAFLSDGHGDFTARVEVVHPNEERTIYRLEHGISISNRLKVVPYRYQVNGCVSPEPGTYEVLLFLANELVVATSFTIRQEEPDGE